MTLTHLDIFSRHGPVVNFRVDQLLPRENEDDMVKHKKVPLFGMAVAPLQGAKPMLAGEDGEERGGAESLGVRRWRLILHNYDHTVLSYELSRDDETNDLWVFHKVSRRSDV